MLKEAIGTGETLEEALEDACRQLGVQTHEATDYEVLERPVKRNSVFSEVRRRRLERL